MRPLPFLLFNAGLTLLRIQVSVVRPQDIAVAGKGTLTLDPNDSCIVVGKGTNFLVDFAPKKQIMLARDLGNAVAEVLEVLDDNRVRIKKEFNKRATDGLLAKADGSAYKVSSCCVFATQLFGY